MRYDCDEPGCSYETHDAERFRGHLITIHDWEPADISE